MWSELDQIMVSGFGTLVARATFGPETPGSTGEIIQGRKSPCCVASESGRSTEAVVISVGFSTLASSSIHDAVSHTSF